MWILTFFKAGVSVKKYDCQGVLLCCGHNKQEKTRNSKFICVGFLLVTIKCKIVHALMM